MTLTDDLAGVLAHADYNDDAVIAIDGKPVGSAVLDDTELSWSGTLKAGEVATMVYSVTVHADAGGSALRNSAEGAATPPGGGDPIAPPSVSTEHPVNKPGFEISKTSDPGGTPGGGAAGLFAASPTRVDPGQKITYTVTGTNTGQTALDPVTLTDDLSGVLPHASYNEDAVATIDGRPAGSVTRDGDTISWTGKLEVGQSVKITYSATVHADAGGKTLRNSVSGSATPPGGADPLTPPEASTEHRVNQPGFSLAKTADPPSGSAIDPGQKVTYTLTAANTGETRLDPVTLTDDLSAVLAHAKYNGDAAVETNDLNSGELTVEGDVLSWTGVLDVGATVTVTYSVTVDASAAGEILKNTVSGTATAPGGGDPITPPTVSTEHPVNKPGFEIRKSADPVSGTEVRPGQKITYTVSAANTGQTALEAVTVADDLSKVLAGADYTGDARALIDDADAGEVRVDGAALTWSGHLAVGQTVTIRYSVKVHENAGGTTLKNSVTGSARTPDGSKIDPPRVTTEHPVAEPERLGTAPSPGAPAETLSKTGSDGDPAVWLSAAGAALLLLGAVTIRTRRRRSRS